MDMTERRRKILRAVVEHYIETAEPVGSKVIAQLAHLDCSSATTVSYTHLRAHETSQDRV